MNVQVNQNERLIRSSDPAIRYTGRIDNSNPDAPFLIYVCSQVEFRVTGHVLRVFIENIHSFYENRLGVIINGVESAVLLESGAQVIALSDRMTDGENHVLLFKRQDCCHALVLHGFAVAEDAELLPLPPRPKRRMEVYGDSVSAGEVPVVSPLSNDPAEPNIINFTAPVSQFTSITSPPASAEPI